MLFVANLSFSLSISQIAIKDSLIETNQSEVMSFEVFLWLPFCVFLRNYSVDFCQQIFPPRRRNLILFVASCSIIKALTHFHIFHVHSLASSSLSLGLCAVSKSVWQKLSQTTNQFRLRRRLKTLWILSIVAEAARIVEIYVLLSSLPRSWWWSRKMCIWHFVWKVWVMNANFMSDVRKRAMESRAAVTIIDNVRRRDLLMQTLPTICFHIPPLSANFVWESLWDERFAIIILKCALINNIISSVSIKILMSTAFPSQIDSDLLVCVWVWKCASSKVFHQNSNMC